MNIDKAAILIKKAALEFDKMANPPLAAYGLTAAQYKTLKFLYAMWPEPARSAQIERYYSLTHPTAIRLLDTLERKGFIFRERDPGDARSRLIFLTAKAKVMRPELVALGQTLEGKLTARLSAKERERLIFLLRKMLGIDDVTETE